MRFMIMIRCLSGLEVEAMQATANPALSKAMAAYHDELAKAGVLLDAGGLQASRHGWRMHFEAGASTRVDGPFADAEEIAGYTLIQVRSREEAMEWSRRFPQPAGLGGKALIEVRQLHDVGGPWHSRAENAATPSS